MSRDSFKTRRRLGAHAYYSLPALAEALGTELGRLPFSLRVLLENLLRHEDGRSVTIGSPHYLEGFRHSHLGHNADNIEMS